MTMAQDGGKGVSLTHRPHGKYYNIIIWQSYRTNVVYAGTVDRNVVIRRISVFIYF